MIRTFKILSALLSYPTLEIQEAAGDFLGVLKSEALLKDPEIKALTPLIGEISTRDIYDLQERYVLLFDRTRSLSLHLFEHVHGESRDRGQAMVDLGALYSKHGLDISTEELPDYLPLFLEFLSVLSRQEALDYLTQPAHVLATLAERLERRRSSYQAVFNALTALTGVKEVPEELAAEPEDDPNDLAALDAAWEAEQVTFGPGAALADQKGCPQAREMLNRMAEAPMKGKGA